jgi:hypothetical protein
MSRETIATSAFRVHRSEFSCSLAAALLDDLFEHPANRGELYSVDDEMGVKIRWPA